MRQKPLSGLVLMPRLEVCVIEGADHVNILERPELLAAIQALLDES